MKGLCHKPKEYYLITNLYIRILFFYRNIEKINIRDFNIKILFKVNKLKLKTYNFLENTDF